MNMIASRLDGMDYPMLQCGERLRKNVTHEAVCIGHTAFFVG